MKRLFLVLCLTLVSHSAIAMIVRVPLDKMVQDSADVVQGRVIHRESRWNDERTAILTEIQIAVEESWMGKSSAGKTLTIQTQGGIVGEIGEVVEHQPVFGATEEVVLFLQSDGRGNVHIHNDEQGKYSVGGEYIVGFDLVPQNLSSFRQRVSELSIKQEGPR